MKVLIIDDNVLFRTAIGNALPEGVAFEVASDGAMGFDLFCKAHSNNEPFDVLFSDIMMPEMNGQELLKTIRKWESEHSIFGTDCVKIIMTTSMGDSKNIMEAFKSQCDGYIKKPFDKNAIIVTLRELGFAVDYE